MKVKKKMAGPERFSRFQSRRILKYNRNWMFHDFDIRGVRTRLWQRNGESYGHILMKALGFAMFQPRFPNLEIERKVGLRYKPDLIALNDNNGFEFWGECGQNSLRKTHWILKHTTTRKMVLFKIGLSADSLVKQLRDEIPARYRPARRLVLVNFVSEIEQLTESKQIAKVSEDWFSELEI